jgi:hypothetical protein
MRPSAVLCRPAARPRGAERWVALMIKTGVKGGERLVKLNQLRSLMPALNSNPGRCLRQGTELCSSRVRLCVGTTSAQVSGLSQP